MDSSPRSRLRLVANGLACAALFLTLLWFPWPYQGRLLDDSWSLALGHFMHVHARAGVDYVFPYGPLGYFAVPALLPELFGLKYLWAIAVAAAGSAAVVRVATLIQSIWIRVLWLWLAVLFLPRTENRFVILLVLVAILHVIEDAWAPARIIAASVLFSAVGLVKFTYLILASLFVALLTAAAPRRSRPLIGVAYLTSLTASWLVSGQSLLDFPRYLGTSLDLATGYSEAMSQDGSRTHVALACVAIVFTLVGVALWRPSRRIWPGLAMLLAGALVSWKESFVRQDPERVRSFFGYLALASVVAFALLRSRTDRVPPVGRALLFGAPALSVAFAMGVEKQPFLSFVTRAGTWSDAWDSGAILVAPGSYLTRSMPAVRAGVMKWLLPVIGRRIGHEAMDVVTVDQAVAVFNGFEYRPRPVFQSYTAYTPALAELNGAFYRGPRAPRYVLSRWTTIDGRFPAADDAPVLFELLRRYRPVLTERDYLLLEHTSEPDAVRGPGRSVLAATAKRGARLSLPTDREGLYTISIDARITFAERASQIMFRGKRLPFIVELEGGERKHYELVPRVTSVPFVISPLLEGNDDLARFYNGAGRRVAAVVIPEETGATLKAFDDEFDVSVVRYPWPR